MTEPTDVTEVPEVAEVTETEATTEAAETTAETTPASEVTEVPETAAAEEAPVREPLVIDRAIQTVGRRKEAVVRVRLTPGTGKFLHRHSGFPGGLRSRALGDELAKHADRVVEKAIVGMLPHNKLSRQVQKKLRVYVGAEHPHTAQQPIPYEIKQVAQ